MNWLVQKTKKTTVRDLIADYSTILHHLHPDNPSSGALQLLHQSLLLSQHVILQDSGQIAGQIHGRFAKIGIPGIASMLTGPEARTAEYWLRPLIPSLTFPSGRLPRTIEVLRPILAIALSPDCARFATSELIEWNREIHIWQVETQELLRRIPAPPGRIESIHFSQDGKRLIVGPIKGTIDVWDVETGNCLRTLSAVSTGKHCNDFILLLSDNGNTIAATVSDELWLWHTDQDAHRFTISEPRKMILGAAISNDASRCITHSSNLSEMCEVGEQLHYIAVWNLFSGTLIGRLRGHATPPGNLTISSDGQRAAFVSDKDIWLWDLETFSAVERLHTESRCARLQMSADGKRLVYLNDDAVLFVWDYPTGSPEPVGRIDYGTHCRGKVRAITPDGDHAITDGPYST